MADYTGSEVSERILEEPLDLPLYGFLFLFLLSYRSLYELAS